MGCDIHMYPERKQGQYWYFAWRFKPSFWSERDGYPPRDRSNALAWDDRWYWLFGQLAGVRREVTPIAEPKGLPEDISDEVKEEMEDPDYHTKTWLSLSELQAHPWEEKHDGTVEPNQIKEIRDWIAELATLDPDPNKVRIVFAFDN